MKKTTDFTSGRT